MKTGKDADMKIKKYAAFFLVLFFFWEMLPAAPAHALEPPSFDEEASVLISHNESGTLLYEKSKDDYLQAGPAARLMAALVFDEFYKDSTDRVVTVNRRVTGLASSTMNPGLKSGEKIPVYDLLCGMLIANSDDAVYALAFDMFGDDEGAPSLLVEKMNRKARDLGMDSTLFLDPVGKDPEGPEQSGSYSSLRDILTLALEVQKSDRLTKICAIDDYTVSATDKTAERRLLTRNYLLSAKRLGGYTYKYATGLAAQDSDGSGYCTIATADFGGKKFTCVVMGAREERYGAFKIAAAFFDWANSNFSYKKVLDTTSILGEIRVALSGDSDYIAVAPQKSVSAFLPNETVVETDIEVRTELSFSKLTAPVYEGLIAGKARVLYKGRELATVDLVTVGSLSQSNNIYYLSLVRKFVTSEAFVWICGVIAAVLILYVLINARVRYLRQKSPSSLLFDEEFDESRGEPPPIGGRSADGKKFSEALPKDDGKNGRDRKSGETGKGGDPEEPAEPKKEIEVPENGDAQKKPAQKEKSAENGKQKKQLSDRKGRISPRNGSAAPLRPVKRPPESAGEPASGEEKSNGDYVPDGWGKPLEK